MILQIAVCDDDSAEREEIIRAAEACFQERQFHTQIVPFASAEELLDSGKRFDLYLLDVLMPGRDGISAAGLLKRKDPEAVIVFITSSLDSAVDSYKVEAAGFLLKPVTAGSLGETADRLIRRGRIGNKPSLEIIYDHMPMEIPLDRIVVLESDLHRVHIRLTGDIYTISTRLKELEEKLTGRGSFLRCHQSFLINLKYASSIEGNAFLLRSGLHAGISSVPISRVYLKSSKKAFYDYRLKNREM